MAAARSTLGDGRTRITNPTSATTHTTAASLGPARHQRTSPRTIPTMIATLEPANAGQTGT